MNIAMALKTHLLTHAGVAALVGTRVFAAPLPASGLPAISFQRISTRQTKHRGNATHGRIRYQVDAWAGDFGSAVALRKQVRAAMAAFQSIAAPRAGGSQLDDDRDLTEPEAGRWRASMDYLIWATED